MKTKTVSVLFICAAALIAGSFFVYRAFVSPYAYNGTRAKIVAPKAASADGNGSEDSSSASAQKSESYETFVTLLPTETLISSLTMDLNDDGLDDDVIVVRRAGSPDFIIVPAIYNQEASSYERLGDIPTKISRTRTFSYTGIDIIGDHHNALVYQGTDDNGNSVMQIFRIRERNGESELVRIGDFVSDGTIFIQQTERSDSYALSLSNGEPFSVWVYKSDRSGSEENAASLNQIQQEYKWNQSRGQYELFREINVTASRLAERELSRILDGTVETFAAFLNGLWYKTSNEDGSIRYIYFNYDDKEVIQLHEDTQEVYEWEDSKIRHNGIYLTTVNSSITTLNRRFDISTNSADEIRITLRDSINLVIGESTLWDGDYKKLSLQSTFYDSDEVVVVSDVMPVLEEGGEWTSADSLSSILFKDSVYTFKSGEIEERGVYSVMKIGSYDVVEFRSDNEASLLGKTYSMEFGTKTIEETVRRQTVERIVPDYNTVILEPVKITPTDCFAADGKTFTFTRD